MCLRQAKGVSIEGHSLPDYDGVYTHDSTHEGWPVLRGPHEGYYFYRYTPTDTWFLAGEFHPDEDSPNAKIVAKEGLLPIGAHTWQCWDDGEFVDGTLTVGLLVRPLPPLPSPLAALSAKTIHLRRRTCRRRTTR
eukprot:COSAG04_NODE_78_length_28355_cov_17.016457_18_plen_135_part_00